MTQTDQDQYFEITVQDPQLYIFLEVAISSPLTNTQFPPILLAQKSILPSYQSDTDYAATKVDFNAHYQNKSYHHIILDPVNMYINQKVYALLRQGQSGGITYSVAVSQSSIKPCPNDCTPVRGICESSGVCLCNNNYIDEDCSRPAAPIEVNEKRFGAVQPQSWVYLHYQHNELEQKDIRLTLATMDSFAIHFAYTVQGLAKSHIPTLLENSHAAVVPGSSQLSLTIERTLIFDELGSSRKIVLGFYNGGSEPANFNIQIDYQASSSSAGDKPSALKVLLYVFGILCSLLIIGILCRKHQIYRKQQKAR